MALLWLVAWFPSYWLVWGRTNFLHLCDVSVILTCAGLWSGSALLLSSQAVSSILADILWSLDAAWRLLLGRHLIGGTEYMWDAQYPLAVRLLSLFHVFLPVIYVWALRRVGYDRRGWLLQSAIALVLLPISRLTDPATNINYAFRDPLFHRTWGPAPAHLALMLAGLIAIFYWPTHQVLAWVCAEEGRRGRKG